MDRPQIAITETLPKHDMTPTTVLPFPAAPEQQAPAHPEYRRSVLEPSIGNAFRLVYRDEHGDILLDWACSVSMPDDLRAWVRKVQQSMGDKLPAAHPTPRSLFAPRLVP